LAEPEAAWRQAVALKPDFALAYCNLGLLLKDQGRLTEALAALKRGHEIGCRQGWTYPSAQEVRAVEKLVALDAKLPKYLSGDTQPASAGQRITLAHLCHLKKRYAATARFYWEAFNGQPSLAADLQTGHRYDAACAAALAAAGQGQDAASLGPMQRLTWRRQALTWLCADLRAWQQILARGPVQARPVVAQTMQHWLDDPDFKGVRGAEVLSQLPPEEGAAWTKLWAGVADLLARAKEPMPKDKETPDKP
jgi:hypothetical protein